MDVSLLQLLEVTAILFASSVLQGAVGFASGLFGIPLMMLTGLTLPEAVTVALIASGVQNLTGSWQLRREIDWSTTWRPVLIRTAAIPLGVWVLWLAGMLSEQRVKQIIGVVILAILIVQWLWRVRPRDSLHVGWEWFAFSLSGFMLGFCGMGGPPMVLWVMAHRWSSRKWRAFLFIVFLSGMIPQLLLLYAVFGDQIHSALLLGLVGVPITFAGTYFGLAIGHRLPLGALRAATYAILVLIAVMAIAAPLMSAGNTAAAAR